MPQETRYKILLPAFVFSLFLLTGCSGRVSPEVQLRVYENVSLERLKDAIPKAFSQAGYITTEAKWTEKATITTVDGAKKETKIYLYGNNQLPFNGSFYHCMKLGTAAATPAKENVYLVELQSLEVTCYQSIGKVEFAVDKDTATYTNFFNALTSVLGTEPKKIGPK